MRAEHPPPRGDEAELYRRLSGPLERVVRARVSGAAATVEDACAFAWEQLLRHQPERLERLFGWLVTVATREGWRLPRIERRQPPAGSSQLEHGAAPEYELEQRGRALEALQALAGLRPAERRLLSLRAAGYSYREIEAIERRSYNYVIWGRAVRAPPEQGLGTDDMSPNGRYGDETGACIGDHVLCGRDRRRRAMTMRAAARTQ